jgi:NADH:ubiquinone oxidoreductase subunit K
MLRFIVGVFMVLHGLVHLLYAGHSWRLFEVRPGLAWPDGSWAFSRLLGDPTTRALASVLYVLATVVFVVGGVGIFARQEWWRAVVVGAAAFSTVVVLLFWDGRMQALTDQGLIAMLINVAILLALLVLRWPSLGF